MCELCANTVRPQYSPVTIGAVVGISAGAQCLRVSPKRSGLRMLPLLLGPEMQLPMGHEQFDGFPSGPQFGLQWGAKRVMGGEFCEGCAQCGGTPMVL